MIIRRLFRLPPMIAGQQMLPRARRMWRLMSLLDYDLTIHQENRKVLPFTDSPLEVLVGAVTGTAGDHFRQPPSEVRIDEQILETLPQLGFQSGSVPTPLHI